jgi:monoamine oxidase
MPISRRSFLGSSASLIAASSVSRVAYAAGSGDPDVIVIGAGLSGLETTLTLQENGLKVLMLEGRRNHIGGRVYSLFDVPGHPEVGGNTIAAAYGRMIAAGNKYGVEIVNHAPRMFKRPGQELYLAGEHIALKDWPSHPRNPFAAGMKSLPPWAWGDAMFKQHMPFKELEQWADPKNYQYDVSVHDFLRSKGATDAMIRLGYDTNIAYGTSAYEVSLLMQAFSDYWQQVNRGALFGVTRTGAGGNEKPAAGAPPAGAAPAAGGAAAGGAKPNPAAGIFVGAYKGGNQNLPIAMSKRVKGDLLMGKRVVAIEISETSAKVRCEDGSTYRAKAVVCSMPFTTLRHVAIDPMPPDVQNRAIFTLGTIPITQVHLVPTKPFWDEDGLLPGMWTDGIAGTVLPSRFGKTDDEVTSLTAWQRGLNAQYVDRMGLENIGKAVVAEIERIRPAAKGKLRIGGVHSWALDPFAAGDWAIYKPGQVREFAAVLAKPHQRLFFCGEHTAMGSRGMEGAMESAERASLEVLGALG